ncbi:MAG: NADH-quinone oxidoreductase subunit N [Bacteriovoracia bacterium]
MNLIIDPKHLEVTAEQISALMPYLIVMGGATLAILLSVVKSLNPKWSVFVVSVLTVAAGLWASFTGIGTPSVTLFNNMMVGDDYSNFFNLIFLGSALFTVLSSFRYLDKESLQFPEYNILVLFCALGMMFLACSLDMIVIFIALELMSLTAYSLVGFRRADRRANEASMKYFILGGAASAILLYGTALLYGLSGSTNIRDILAYVGQNAGALPVLFSVGAWLVLVGFLFKVASVPFHMWMPDVYEGAPTPVTGLMTTGIKAASFAVFLRVFISFGYGKSLVAGVQMHLHDLIWISAVLTMLFGNVIALQQTNLKRMLAYSSIAHTGYLMVGLLSGSSSEIGYSALVLYLVSYAVMNMGAFAILSIISGKGDEGLQLQDMSGLAKRHPWLAFAMAVFLFSMAGVPPTAGFVTKYLLFYSAVQAGEIWLVVLSVLCSAISAYYYLRVLVFMYMKPATENAHPRISFFSAATVAVMALVTLQVGILPSALVDLAKKVVGSL